MRVLLRGERVCAGAARYRLCSHAPKMDCNPDSPTWQAAPIASGCKDAFTNRPAEDQTEARITYDADSIYVLFVCYASRPQTIVGREIEPEATFNGEDIVTFSLDTFNTRSGTWLSKFTVYAINPRTETIAGGHSSSA